MLKKPKHFPVYVVSYLYNGKIGKTSIIAKISKGKNLVGSWKGVSVLSIDLYEINNDRVYNYNAHSQAGNTYDKEDAILVPKDVWIKYVNKVNKLIDEANKKGSTIKRISY